MTRTRMMRVAASVGAVLWMGLIYGLSTLPGSAVPGHFGSLGHYILYAALGALFLLALPPTSPPWRAAITAIVLASLYGVTDEFHQSFVPGRVPDVGDWLVDTAGAITAVVVIVLTRRARANDPERSVPE